MAINPLFPCSNLPFTHALVAITLNATLAGPVRAQFDVPQQLDHKPERLLFFDADNDGDLDIAFSADSLFLGFNRGDGIFVDIHGLRPRGISPASLHDADIDLDGDADLLVFNEYQDDPRYWLANDGSGGFTMGGNFPGAQFSDTGGRLFTKDLNGDTLPEVILCSHGASSPRVIVNQWPTPFGQQYILNEAPRRGMLADMDLDGQMDFVGHGGYPYYTLVFSRGSNLTFSSIHDTLGTVPGQVDRLDVADLDLDGDTDLVVVCQDSLRIMLHDTSTGLTTSGVFTRAGLVVPNDPIADLDGDGLQDVMLYDDYEVFYFRNLGGGSFAEAVSVFTDNGLVTEPRCADLDNDGLLDLIHFEWYRPVWRPQQEQMPYDTKRGLVTYHSYYPSFGDMDNDGDLDVLVSGMWVEQRSDGSFSGGHTINFDAADCGAADLDDDGFMDAFTEIQPYIGNVYWYPSGTEGDWPEVLICDEYEPPSEVTPADPDANGTIDLIRSHGILGVEAYVNDGSGSFVLDGLLGNQNSQGPTVAVADLDGDGDQDIAANGASGILFDLLVARNDGAWEFTGNITQVGPDAVTDVQNIRAGDIDGDGDPDLLTDLNGELAWYENLDGIAVEWDLHALGIPVPSLFRKFCLGELDGNGLPDIVFVHEDQYSASFMLNSGNGTFAAPIPLPFFEDEYVESVRAIDLNGDGFDEVLRGGDLHVWLYSNFGLSTHVPANPTSAALRVTPNPMTADAWIQGSGSSGPSAVFRLFDHGGRLVRTFPVDASGSTRFDRNGLPSGIHTLVLTGTDRMFAPVRIVVE